MKSVSEAGESYSILGSIAATFFTTATTSKILHPAVHVAVQLVDPPPTRHITH